LLVWHTRTGKPSRSIVAPDDALFVAMLAFVALLAVRHVVEPRLRAKGEPRA
jgi:hypothetical protein